METNQKHPIEEVIADTLKNIKNIVEIDTIVGNPVKTENENIIIPISKVTIGYLGGGGEYYDTKVKKVDHPFALGSGAGMSISPIGFIVEENGVVRYIETEKIASFEKIVNIISDAIKSFKLGKNGDTNNDKKD